MPALQPALRRPDPTVKEVLARALMKHPWNGLRCGPLTGHREAQSVTGEEVCTVFPLERWSQDNVPRRKSEEN